MNLAFEFLLYFFFVDFEENRISENVRNWGIFKLVSE
jgi:hypothetical protein